MANISAFLSQRIMIISNTNELTNLALGIRLIQPLTSFFVSSLIQRKIITSILPNTMSQRNRAKEEIREKLIELAQKESSISYKDLAAQIESMSLKANDVEFFNILEEISIEENNAGRGLLSVLVVRSDSVGLPGSGFYDLARSLGRVFNDKKDFWEEEANRVYEAF